MLVPQVLVTDPAPDEGAGYMVVGRSPLVRSDEVRELDDAVGATDFLHETEKAGPYFSFFPLASGRWACCRRFLSGKRRGAYNRIVAHVLLLEAEPLAKLGHDVRLLSSSCRYRSPSMRSPELLPACSARAASSADGQLEDLELLLPRDVRAASAALDDRLTDHLLGCWGHRRLTSALRWVLQRSEAGTRVLLPQETACEALLKLAWSRLPPGTRRRTSWTTHLAPPVSRFRLANGTRGAGVGWCSPPDSLLRPSERRPLGVRAEGASGGELVGAAAGADRSTPRR
ncbi:MAG: hypothetical protein AAF533_13050 [Acidobacteriota bacterium]